MNIKTVEELFNESFVPSEVDSRANFYLSEIEELIKKAIIQGRKLTYIDVNYLEFNFSSLSNENIAKVMLFKIIEVLKEKKYKIELEHNPVNYYFRLTIKFDIQCVESKLNNYLNQYFK